MDDAEVQILLQWKERGRAVLEENKLALAEINAQLAFRDALRAAGVISADAETVATQGNTDATVENAVAQGDDAAATDENAASQAGLADLLTGITIPAWVGVAAAIGVVIASLSPFIILVGSAIVIAVAFGVAATGMALAVTGATIALGGLGLGLVVLANGFAWVNNSMGNFKKALQEMGLDLAQLASGDANKILQFLTGFVPLVETAGRALIGWLDPRLPALLQMFASMGTSALGGFAQVASAIGAAFDKVGGSGIAAMFQQFASFGAGALVGLIQNLTALGLWFEQRLPTYGPIAQQIFGAIGTAVQFVAYWWGRFSDFLVANWPTIVDNANRAVKSFQSAWEQFQPVLQYIADKLLPLLPPLLKIIADHFGAWAPFVIAIIGGLLILATVILAVAAAIEMMLTWVGNAKNDWNNFEISVIQNVRGIIAAMNRLPGVNIALPDLPGQGGSYSQGGRSGGTQTTPGGSKTAINITVQGGSSSDPTQMAQTTASILRKAMAV